MRRGVSGTLCLAAVCLAVMASVITPTAHAAPQYEAAVVFTQIVADDNGVSLAGTITNTGTDPLFNVQVELWRDRTPLTTPDQLDQALAADPDLDTGIRIQTTDSISVVCSGTTTFDPDDSAGFTVSATWDEMNIHADGVYLVGAQVRATSASWGSRVTIGRGRTLATVANAESAQAATVVMLTSAPSLVHDTVFKDDHLADELSGRLATLLDLARQPGVSWVVDPALIDEVTRMADGYEVLAAPPGGSDTTPGTGSAQAQTWLAAFRSLNQAQGYRLPWGNPDLALGARTDTDLIARSQDEDLPMYDLGNLPLLLRSGNGQADSGLLDAVAALQPDIVLADAESGAVLPHGVLLTTLPVPYPGGPGPDADTPLQRQFRALAEDAVNSVTIRVISTEEDAGLASGPVPAWVTPVLLSSIHAQADWTPDLSRGTPAGPLTSATLDRVREVQNSADTYASLISDPAAVSSLTEPAMARLASQSWEGDEPAAAYSASVNQWISSILSSVSLTATPEVSLTSRTAPFPVTVTNKLDVPVSVRISTQIVPLPQSLANLTIGTTGVETIQPGDKVPVLLSPTVIREGDADVILTLTTQDGFILDASATVRIHASSSSWMGWAVVGAAAVLFIVGTFLRVRSKSRANGVAQEAPHE